MEADKFDILKKEFSADFTDRVMDEVHSNHDQIGGPGQVRLLNIFATAAAACLLLFGSYVLYKGGGLDVESQTGLSQYSDFELNTMDYYSEDDISDE
jgi:hypothetical protein